jgi:hypothetical protein
MAAQQAITLRFVDYRDGNPIRGIRVLSIFWDGTIPSDGLVTPGVQKVASKIPAKTDSKGLIKLQVPISGAQHLEISSPFDTLGGVHTQLPVKEVLANGMTVIADADHSGDSKSRAPASSGEVVIVTRKLTASDRMRQEFP